MSILIILQLATLAVSATGPILAYRYARRLASTKNSLAWVDSLREDVAQCIALWSETSSLYTMASALKNPQSKLAAVNEQREKTYLLAVILFRIRLRLRSGEPTHDRLRTALAKFGEGRAEQNDIVRLRNEALAAAEAIIQEIWRQVQGGRVKGKGG